MVRNEAIQILVKHLYSQQVLNLKASEARIFIMNVHSGYAQPILEAAQAAGLVGPDYAWVVTDGTVKDAVITFTLVINYFHILL